MVAVTGAGQGASRSLLVRSGHFLARRPVLFLLLLRIAEALWQLWLRRRRLALGRQLVQNASDDVEGEFVQGCLISAENLPGLGRVEKRTLFVRPLLELLRGNEYLKQHLLQAAQRCRANSHNCMVARWLPEDERYFVLQACLNAMSSLFGPDYVHFNGLDGDPTSFTSSWFCLTVMTPTWQRSSSRMESKTFNSQGFRRMSTSGLEAPPEAPPRTPRPTLRIVLVNESELKFIADGKLSPPHWGFFNERHAERFRLLQHFARNFQHELHSAEADGGSGGVRGPFTSGKAHQRAAAPGHSHRHHHSKPDGGMLKRVQSQPDMKVAAMSANSWTPSLARRGEPPASDPWLGQPDPRDAIGTIDGGVEGCLASRRSQTLARLDSCFLRLHVPHFVGEAGCPRAISIATVPSASALQGSGAAPTSPVLPPSPSGLLAPSLGHSRTRSTGFGSSPSLARVSSFSSSMPPSQCVGSEQQAGQVRAAGNA